MRAAISFRDFLRTEPPGLQETLLAGVGVGVGAAESSPGGGRKVYDEVVQPRTAAWMGSVKQKALPSPKLLSAHILPPWPCTMHFEM